MNQAKQAVNPYLPSYEYVPDGEPHVFNGRVYVYGSHDRFGGDDFCLNDYVCWSARADDLANWRYEGTSYRSVQDPLCAEGSTAMRLFAPDVQRGGDGRTAKNRAVQQRGPHAGAAAEPAAEAAIG